MLPFTDDEIISIIKSKSFSKIGDWPARNKALFVVQLCLGPRINEMLQLTIGDVINKNGAIKREIVLQGNITKTGKTRIIKAINPLLFHFLPPWLKILNNSGYMTATSPLFPGRGRTKHLSDRQVRYIYQAAINECNIGERHSTHSCRKTWACQTYDWLCDEMRKGANIDPLGELTKIGGWETETAARKYIADHVSKADDSQAAIYSNIIDKL